MSIFHSSDLKTYKTLDDDKKIKDFLYEIDGFHDSVCHEIRFLYNACVFQNGMMNDTGGYCVRALFHSQFINECPAYEIIFANVVKFHITNNFIGDCEFKIKRTRDCICFEAMPELLFIEAQNACYKILTLDVLPIPGELENDQLEEDCLSRAICKFSLGLKR